MEVTLARALEDLTRSIQELQRRILVLETLTDPQADLPDIEMYLQQLEEEIEMLRTLQASSKHRRDLAHAAPLRPEVHLIWHNATKKSHPNND